MRGRSPPSRLPAFTANRPRTAKAGLAQYGTRSVSDGADTALWPASSADLDGVTGRFFEQGAEKPPFRAKSGMCCRSSALRKPGHSC
jgi:hypothetical protein